MTGKLISFENVGKVFHADGRTVEAVRGISLDVARGEFVTLVGPSGCGKSTLLNMTAGCCGRPPARCAMAAPRSRASISAPAT